MKKDFGFIFDLDGTLIDSFGQIFETLISTSDKLKIGKFNKQITWRLFGQSLDEIILANGVPASELDLFISSFRIELKNRIEKENRLYDGAYEVLEFLAIRNIPIGIATSKAQNLAELVYENSKLADFKMTIRGTGQLPAKPNPATIISAMEDLGVGKGVMIGDRLEDALAGAAANLKTCAITQTFHSRTDFETLGVNYHFDNMKELHQRLSFLIEEFENAY